MVDVPRHRHVLLGEGDPLLDGVRHIGGEPRMLHLYAEADAAADLLARVARGRGRRGPGCSRATRPIAAGLFGPVDAAVLPRIGDVLVAARSGIAYYDDRLDDKGAQSMVGPARLAHERGAHRPADPTRRVRLRRRLSLSVRAPKTISSHDGIDVRPLRAGRLGDRRTLDLGLRSVVATRGGVSSYPGSSASNRATGAWRAGRGRPRPIRAAARAARADVAAPRAGRPSRPRSRPAASARLIAASCTAGATGVAKIRRLEVGIRQCAAGRRHRCRTGCRPSRARTRGRAGGG